MPRVDLNSALNVSMVIRRDGDGKKETITSFNLGLSGNFNTVEFASSILEEGSTYFVEIEADDNLAYRDKIFCTGKNDYTVKHVSSQDIYVQPDNEINDNTYII